MPRFDFHAGGDLRLFSEFEFDYEDERNGGPRPQIDEDKGDVHQTFIEIGSHVSNPHGLSLRAGRQEVVFGTGRLFDNNEGPNVKLSFDGFRGIAKGTGVRLDLFAVKPVENNTGFFDDVPNHSESLKSATYNRGTAHELRHSVGTRVFRPIGKGLDYNCEPNF